MSGGERVVRLAARGDGVTESGRFVRLAAPGDLWIAEGTLRPGPHRQPPPCRHFPACGGCQLQHVDDPAFADYLVDRVGSALAAQKVKRPTLRTPHLSPPNSRRRASLRAERRGSRSLIGFNAEASHTIVDMRECHILHPELFALVDPIRSLLGELAPQRRRLEVRMTLADQGPDLLLTGLAPEGLEASERLTAFAGRHSLARLALDSGFGAETIWEPEPATITLSGVAVPLPHAAFLQATREGQAALVSAVREAIGGARLCLDLFAGLGTFALALEGRVLAVEGVRDAALALKGAAARAGRPLFVEHRDLFRRPLTAAELDRFEAVILDPPRAGAKEQAFELARSNVARIAYVSCNPATFARDATLLIEGGYDLEWIQPVGQFRWSTHVELAALFMRPV